MTLRSLAILYLLNRTTLNSIVMPLMLLWLLILNCAPVVAQTEDKQWNVAILVFERVQIIDYAGPYEVFINASSNNHPRFNVYTVAPEAGMIKTIGGMSVIPDYDLGNCPNTDILILPGGWGVFETRKSDELVKWIKERSQQAQIVLSVCNGAFFLSRAGLLDGLEATTVAGAIPRLQEEAKTCNVLRNKRFVDNGKIITSAGLSSGIDASLHVVSKILSKGWAQRIAIDMEYDWRPDSSFARALLADQYLIPPYTLPVGYREPISYHGDTDHWETVTIVETDQPAAQVLESVNQLIVKMERFLNWKKREGNGSLDTTTSRWTFVGREGKQWNAFVSVNPVVNQVNKVKLTMEVSRIDYKKDGR